MIFRGLSLLSSSGSFGDSTQYIGVNDQNAITAFNYYATQEQPPPTRDTTQSKTMSRASRISQVFMSPNITVPDISRFVHLNEVAPDRYEEAGFGGSRKIYKRGWPRAKVKCIRPKSTDESEEVSKDKINKKVARELSIWQTLNGGRHIVELLGVFCGIKSIPSLVSELCPWNLQEYLERKTPRPKHIKMGNILVTPDETAKLCDFGRSHKRGDPRGEVSHSSVLAGTVRYMSPELFDSNLHGPTPAADMWAYGCIALEVMCRIPPYHETADDLEIIRLITNGQPPSDRPKGARASLVNDGLWSALASCWVKYDRRPTPQECLGQILSMMESGDIPASPVLPDLFPGPEGGSIEQWPDEIPDLKTHLELEEGIGTIASSVRYPPPPAARLTRRAQKLMPYALDYPSFEPHSGLVIEYCGFGNLVSASAFLNVSPLVNAYSIENILIAFDGTAKISLFSFSRALATLRFGTGLAEQTGLLMAFRWMSPELLLNNCQPTTESDMWAIGCVYYWILTDQVPYSNQREDLAGIQSTRGQPPGTLADVYYGYGWITNGIWRSIGRCWSNDPLQRPSALEFCNMLKELERRKIDWLPAEAEDLSGKVKSIGSDAPLMRYTTVWSQGGILQALRIHTTSKYHQLSTLKGQERAARGCAQILVFGVPAIWDFIVLFGFSTSSANFTMAHQVAMKVVGDGPIDGKATALLASIRRETTIVSQLDHPNIVKFLGIDSSYHQGPAMIFELSSETTLEKLIPELQYNFSKGFKLVKDIISALRYLHEHENGAIAHGDIRPANICVQPNGQAKITNFSCAFQYIIGQSANGSPLLSAISTPLLPSLYLEPQSYRKMSCDYLNLPTMAGDIWSLGSVILSLFSHTFRHQQPDIYSSQIQEGVSPCDTHKLSVDDTQLPSLVRSMLAYECSERPSAKFVFESLP
ncbi:Pkinase domain-containing protein [Rhizoctonia solani AG-1 IA]|uniref:Pkinase domain-containing protein n=1 Tax=Thanatephorus cucumeris (strain AG1-IA) TaxID=983506 RepID=L8WNZ3_THACA|nr:Pkinase domain-containing protein [Rhizoctonia solani AG-1 IA]